MLKNSQKAFTLIEILIVTGIFAALMVAVTGIFISALRAEKNIFDSKKVLGQISYAAEYMTRALRMAEKDKTGSCLSSPGSNYENNGTDEVKFINALQGSKCQRFFLENKQIKYDNGLAVTALTSSDISVESLRFSLSGEGQSDELQPFVTIYIEAHAKEGPILKTQTSVSQRDLDVNY